MLLWLQQINAEVVRMTGVDVRAKLVKFFSASRVNAVLDLASSGKLDQQLLGVLEAAGKATNYDAQSMPALLWHIMFYFYRVI